MLLSLARKFIFIHIQKTAGSSVESILVRAAPDVVRRFPDLPACRERLKNRHLFALDLRHYLEPDLWETFYKFAFVRNPWARLVSWYNMCVDRPSSPFMWYIKNHTRRFEDFLILTDGRCRRTTFNQVDYISDAGGNVIVDYVGRFETLADDVAAICRRLSIDAELPRRNAGRAVDYREYYTERSRRLVAERFRRDIEAFGYAFDDGEEGAARNRSRMRPIK